MTTLMFWLKTYWYVPLVVLVGGFFFWQQTKAAPAQSQLAVSVHTTRSHASNVGQSTTIASSRQTRSSTSRPTRGFVHIKGAVQKPGLYPVRADTRWDAVVKAAGGLTDKADISQVNLAMLAVDQESLQIPEKGGAVATAPASGTASIGGTAGQTNAAAGSRAVVNLNTA
ncbi:ComE operon protein 1, partial [Lacticaseibacillus paracasei subsp. paracasei Lpp229]